MSSGEEYREDNFDLYGTPPTRNAGRRQKSSSGQGAWRRKAQSPYSGLLVHKGSAPSVPAGSRRRRTAQEPISARQEASALSAGKCKKRKQAREFKETMSGRRISRMGSSMSLSEASSIGYPESPHELTAFGSAYARFVTPVSMARRSGSDEDRRSGAWRSSSDGLPSGSLDVKEAQACLDDFLQGQSLASLSLQDEAWREAAEWQRKLVAGEVSLDAGLDDCSQAVGQLQKGLVEAKLFHRRLAAQVSSLAMDASARYLIMQAMYEQAVRSLLAAARAVQSRLNACEPTSSEDFTTDDISNEQKGALKVAASVVRLQRKLLTRLTKLIEACREAHQLSETSQAALDNLSQSVGDLVKVAALAVSRVQARALNIQTTLQGEISSDCAQALCWSWHSCGVMVECVRDHATGLNSPVGTWEAVLKQAVQSTTWTIKAVHSANEAALGPGFSYRNALASPAKPLLQQQAAACSAWLPQIAETLWKEVLRLARPSDADESDSEIADPEEESCSISHELAPVLVKLAEAWTQLLEAIPELQLQAPAKRGAAPPSNGSCTRTALEQLERQAGKALIFVHALGKLGIVDAGHQGLWQSTMAVTNALLDWQHILLQAPSPGPSAAKAPAPHAEHGLPLPPAHQRAADSRRSNGNSMRPASVDQSPPQNGRGSFQGSFQRGRAPFQGRASGRSGGRARGKRDTPPGPGRKGARSAQVQSPFEDSSAGPVGPVSVPIPNSRPASGSTHRSSSSALGLPRIHEHPAPRIPADDVGHARPSFRDILTAQGRRAGGAGHEGSPGIAMPPWDGNPDWAVRREELEQLTVADLHKMLGSGSCGAIWMLYFETTLMAVKIPLADDASRQEHLDQFSKELRIHKRVSGHPNVVSFLKAWCHVATPERPFTGLLERLSSKGVSMAILMELCKLGSLHSVIRKASEVATSLRALCNGSMPKAPVKNTAGSMLYHQWRLRLKLAQGAAAAVAYMHAQHPVLLHSDLKSPNFLVTEDFVSKICDFNLSDILGADGCITSGEPISPPWSAPERLSGLPFGTPADVFSFGVVLWELISLETPWSKASHCRTAGGEDSDAASQGSVIDADVELEPVPEEPEDESEGPYWKTETAQLAWLTENLARGARLPLPDPVTFQPPLPELPQLCGLIQRCWDANPAERPTMVEVRDELQQLYEKARRRPS